MKGPGTGANIGRISVMFPGNKGNVACDLNMLSRTPPPPLPGGFAVGEQVFYAAGSHTFPSGNKLTHGQAGEVTGPKPGDPERLAVLFPGNNASVTCELAILSRTPPSTLLTAYFDENPAE